MITYTNNRKLIQDAMNDLIVAEFKPMIIKCEDQFREEELAQQKNYLRYFYKGSDVVERAAKKITKTYNFELVWYFQFNGVDFKSFLEDKVYTRIERLERLFLNNCSYESSGNTLWHYVVFDSDELEKMEDMDVFQINMDVFFTGTDAW